MSATGEAAALDRNAGAGDVRSAEAGPNAPATSGGTIQGTGIWLVSPLNPSGMIAGVLGILAPDLSKVSGTEYSLPIQARLGSHKFYEAAENVIPLMNALRASCVT